MRRTRHPAAMAKRTHPKPQQAAHRSLLSAQVQLLRGMTDATGWKPTQLARASGLAPSTVNRVIQGQITHVLSTTSIAALFDAVEARLRDLGQRHEASTKWHQVLGAWRLSSTLSRPLPAIQVIGHVQAGDWRKAMQWAEGDQYGLHLPLEPRYAGGAFGLEVRGRSMDLIYPEGSLAICVPYSHLGRDPRLNDRVVCVRHGAKGLVEATIKLFDIDSDGRPWLLPRSSDPGLQQPISLSGNSAGAEQIEIIAKVIGSYRPEPE